MFKIKKFVKSFKYAILGIRSLLLQEQNFLFDFVFAIVVLILAFYFPLIPVERAVIIILVFLVLIMEVINSTFERLIDVLEPRLNQTVKTVKDFMSAAVLMMALCAVIVGAIIFLPYILN